MNSDCLFCVASCYFLTILLYDWETKTQLGQDGKNYFKKEKFDWKKKEKGKMKLKSHFWNVIK